ncbi:MAG: type IV secretion system DNA-binding domain-containing protein [Deltaproteobacteria bacterium]|nr:type IV secretion system DNA-binding domain-containing protein [Deltaproteobacteria bacterium]
MILHSQNSLTLFARTNFRNQRKLFGIRRADRRAHMYLIGKTGTGKSTLLETLLRQDMAAGEGLALLDPHGDLVERIVVAVPEHRKNDVFYFNVPDRGQPFGFNPLDSVPPEKRALAASSLLEAFKKIWADTWGPRLEYILRNALLALLDQPHSTLADVLRLLGDKAYRKEVASHTYYPQVRDFWLREYETYPARFRIEAISPIQNKVGAFLANPLLNRIITQPKSTFDVRRIMDEGKILLVNLAKGKIGDDTAALLGAMLVSKIGMAALGRAEKPEEERRDFYLYLDEFQTFTTLSLANMLSELRKYHVGLVLAHQYLSQVEPEVRDAVLGNVGTTISFRLGSADAEILGKEFYPEITALDLVNLPNYQIYLKLMVNGVVSRPFSAETLSHFSSSA